MSGKSSEVPSARGALPARILFDTNVLLDVLLVRDPHVRAAARLWGAVASGRLTGIIAATSLTTVWYLVGRAYDAARAENDVRTMLSLFEVAPVGRVELEQGFRFADYEDGVIHAAARTAAAEGIVTRNVADFTAPRTETMLPTYTPDRLVAILSA